MITTLPRIVIYKCLVCMKVVRNLTTCDDHDGRYVLYLTEPINKLADHNYIKKTVGYV